ncbi:MAG: hypothetical protein CMH55_00160 [Myxococcales bacterium]|nr:hypothetical protein [Myxococcales bacterium]
MPLLLAICFFASGATGLVFEVIWSRLLGQVFGATTPAVATTLSCFMGGLAIGAHLIGKVMHRIKRPALWYAGFEACIGLYALAIPTLLDLAITVQRTAWPADDSRFIVYSLVRLAVVAAILLPPSAFMGATLPLLAEAIARSGWGPGKTVGMLYGLNTLGAVVGAGAVGFFLLPWLGLNLTNQLAAGTDIVLAALLVALLPKFGQDSSASEAPPLEVEAPVPQEDEPSGILGGRARLLIAVVAVSGGISMALQVLWTRGLSMVLGASTYAFTTILVVFLTGLAVGSAVASLTADRDPAPTRRLGILLVLAGIFGFMGTRAIDQMPHWLQSFVVDPELTTLGLNTVHLSFCSLTMLPATLLLGAVFPYVVRGLRPDAGLGATVGEAYAANTIGAIVGSAGAGFVVIPLVGIYTGLCLGHTLHILLGVLLIVREQASGTTRESRLSHGFLALALAGLIWLVPPWDVSRWSLGMFRVSVARVFGDEAAQIFGRLLYHRDGLATTVTVERSDDVTLLKVNGKVDASSHGDMPTQVLSGLLPLVLHGQAEQVAIIGWGSGVTAGATLSMPVKRVKMIEIEEAVVEAGRFFADVNRSPETDARMQIIYDDGRNVMHSSDETFDVIISEPSNPWMSGAAALFTEEFFQVLKSRLKPGGVSLQWIQLYELSPKAIKALLRTYASVFEEILVFSAHPTSNDIFLVGSSKELKLNRDHLLTAMSSPDRMTWFQAAKLPEPVDLLPRLIFGRDEIMAWVGDGPLNTDDNGLVEFLGPVDLLHYADSSAELPFLDILDGRRQAMVEKYTRGWASGGRSMAWGMARAGRYEDARSMVAGGEDPDLIWVLDRMEESAKVSILDEGLSETDPDYRRVAEAMLYEGPEAAEQLLMDEEGLANRSPGHQLLAGYIEFHMEDLSAAITLLQRAARDQAYREGMPAVDYYLARALVEWGEPAEGLEVMLRLGRRLQRAGQRDQGNWMRGSSPRGR